MIVPLMIWSARTMIDSQAWSSRDDASPASDGRDDADQERRRRAEDGRGARPGIALGDERRGHDQPTNAAVSIIPSMPMLTTPERSLITPHSAPSAIGVAEREDDRARSPGSDVDEVADELEDEAEDRDRRRANCPSGGRLLAVRAW